MKYPLTHTLNSHVQHRPVLMNSKTLLEKLMVVRPILSFFDKSQRLDGL